MNTIPLFYHIQQHWHSRHIYILVIYVSWFAGPMYLKMLTSENVILHPPEPLVLQVEAGGEYAGIQWTRTPIALNVSSDELVDFQQTFVRTVTSEQEWGLYQVNLTCPFGVSNCTTISPITIKLNAKMSCELRRDSIITQL